GRVSTRRTEPGFRPFSFGPSGCGARHSHARGKGRTTRPSRKDYDRAKRTYCDGHERQGEEDGDDAPREGGDGDGAAGRRGDLRDRDAHRGGDGRGPE